jgi:hypothetical protein
MLSSVAKTPATTQAVPMVAPPLKPPTNLSTTPLAPIVRPPPLPPADVTPATPRSETPTGKLSSTTFVKLPPKTSVPIMSTVRPPATDKALPPLLPPKRPDPAAALPKKFGVQNIPPIKLNTPEAGAEPAGESILLSSVEAKTPDAAPPEPPATEAKAAAVVPPLMAGEPEPKPALNPAPLALTLAHPVQVAPPLRDQEDEPEPSHEKLPVPHLPSEAKAGEPVLGDEPVKLAPPVDPAATHAHPPPLPAAPLPPPAPASMKLVDPRKKSTPIIVSSTSPKSAAAPAAEAKPSLRPAVLPKRAIPLPTGPEASEPAPATPAGDAAPVIPKAAKPKPTEKPSGDKKDESKEIAISKAETAAVAGAALAAKLDEPKGGKAALDPKVPVEKPSSAPSVPAAGAPPMDPAPPSAPKKTASLPLTRAEKSKRRRVGSVLVFWLLMVPLTGVGLVFGSYYFGRDTRVEGQVIPPPGMTVNGEVWIVTDFRDLAGGVAEDLAAERTPLLQEIQEKREHVQRVQADIAAREDKIHMIQDEIQVAKDDINGLVKKSRDATQQIWNGEGAEIDSEYESKFAALKNAIADRAKALKLQYEPDPTFDSPEVWANAFRLALYQVPSGVDAVKEHQWLGDQMKAWRDFEKSLDDRKEQLREKAAQIKLEPGPKIADDNAKIDDMNQRIDATQAEEVPLKAELDQAQADLAQAEAQDAGLDDKFYKQLYSLPAENITKHITIEPNGRFTWVEDEAFAEGETERSYWIFSAATRSDGRQYWALGRVRVEKDHKVCLLIEPDSYLSTKAILRPGLSPEEQAQ